MPASMNGQEERLCPRDLKASQPTLAGMVLVADRRRPIIQELLRGIDLQEFEPRGLVDISDDGLVGRHALRVMKKARPGHCHVNRMASAWVMQSARGHLPRRCYSLKLSVAQWLAQKTGGASAGNR